MKKKLIIAAVCVAVLLVAASIFAVNYINESDLPKLYFEGDITEMLTKDDERDIAVRYEAEEGSFSGYAELKIQGTSSLAYDKKNYTIKLFSDAEHEEKMRVDMGWGEQNKYCLKANWIDKTHARNVVTANLVTEIQQRYGVLEQAPRNGAIDGFPVEIYSNGKFWGIYTFNIPKDEWTFNMDGDNPDHIVVGGENWEPAAVFHAAPNFESWEVEVGEANDETLAKLSELFDFVMNSTDEEFKADFEKHMDLDAALNYYIIADYAYLCDNLGKNILLATYDGQKWYPVLYDLDTSWGVDWQGKNLWNYENELIYLSNNNLFARLEQNFPNELSERYFELREDTLNKEYVMGKFEAFESQISGGTFIKERLKWGFFIPGYDLSQIEDYIEAVEERLDEKYTELGAK